MEPDMATKRKTGDEENLTKQIAVRVTEADYARLEALSTRIPISALTRVALLVGLDAIEAQPAILLGEEPRKPKR